MQMFMTEMEKWRSAKVAELNGKLLDLAGQRADLLQPYHGARTGVKVPEDVQRQLDELDRESQAIEAQIRETDLEAARREREPVDPTPAIRQLTEELANERHRRGWFCHQIFYGGMHGYRSELEGIADLPVKSWTNGCHNAAGKSTLCHG